MPRPRRATIPTLSSQAFVSACQILAVRPDDVILAPHITQYITDKLALDRDSAVEYLRMSGDPTAHKFLTVYDGPLLTRHHRASLPLEAYCLSAKINPLDLLELLVGVLVRVGAQQSAVIAAVHQPAIVARTVEAALQPENFRERQLFHKATGFLPQPKGSQTSIKVVQQQSQGQQQAQQQETAAPPPEQTIRRLVDRFNDRPTPMPQLPERIPDDGEAIPSVMPPAREAEPIRLRATAVTAPSEYDSEDESDSEDDGE
jgi:hypothetical protein